jgi:intracellular multiplication protein IcmJ
VSTIKATTASLPPLTMSVKRATWRMADAEHGAADKAFAAVRDKVLARDRHTCVYCGFKASSWQEVHHLDDDHANNDPANLATVCSFCHLCFHVGRAGSFREAVLVWMPELGQTQVNHLARAIHVGRHMAGNGLAAADRLPEDERQHLRQLSDLLDGLLAQARQRSEEARLRLGTSDPAILGSALLDLEEADYARRGQKLKGIRLFPEARRMSSEGTNLFPRALEFWTGRKGPFGALPLTSWAGLFASKLRPRVWERWQQVTAGA